MSVQDLIDRQARRKQVGADQEYPQHAKAGKVRERVSLAVTKGPCAHEGPVTEHCRSCRGEWRHVRQCGFEDGQKYGRCVRNAPDKAQEGEIQNCATCPDYQPT